MRLKLNGEDREFKGKTVMELLNELEIIPERVAVEVNLRVIKKADFENYTLNDGDCVEIVYFVGGGNGR